jgi:hypothetical protein
MQTDVAGSSYAALSDEHLLELLRTQEDRLPRAAADEILRRGPALVPALEALCLDERAWRETGPAAWSPVHAAFLLGALGGPAPLPGLLAALRHSARADVRLVWEAAPSMIGRRGRDAVAPLRDAIRHNALGTHERCLAVHALAAVGVYAPVEQGGLLDFLRAVVEDEDEASAVRAASGQVLLAYARPGDRTTALVEALRQKWGEGAPLFDEGDVDAAFSRGGPDLAAYRRDWMAFYDPERISERQARRREEEQDARWSRGAAEGADWVESERGRLLSRYEFALEGLDDLTRGEALWVAESMTEYVVRHEGAAPWRWTARTAHAYLMDAFARRLAADQPGRIASVPDAMARFVRFCATEGLVRPGDLRAAVDRIEAGKDDVVAAALDPERRREARTELRRLLACGVDPAGREEKGTRFRAPGAPVS